MYETFPPSLCSPSLSLPRHTSSCDLASEARCNQHRGYIRGSPDAIIAIAIVQRTRGRRGQCVVGADDSSAIVRVPPGNVSLQVLGLSRRVNAPIPMMVVVVQMMVTVGIVGRPRGRFIAVGHRVRHEGHHFMRFVVGSVRSLAPVTTAIHLNRCKTVLEAVRTSTRSPLSEIITSGGELLTDNPLDPRFLVRELRLAKFEVLSRRHHPGVLVSPVPPRHSRGDTRFLQSLLKCQVALSGRYDLLEVIRPTSLYKRKAEEIS